ncbi:MAG TPA: efflux transporter outer membrane subunit [Pseudomonas sp.]|jgi:NodT family efflux transporter outer membrane factor (OMF) lipoprotein|uniref:efflux transporter outer membrane subunit n=1 Tax=Pseudomonas sp. TaxID=306 RepID=UPI002CF0D182|nr:efflux transporter outer membrane subunit [Pseudomonas sp.]HTO20563.1 efflux transporter outer membrane subunit [Pseudomonas sp.]
MNAPFRLLTLALLVGSLSACALGPDYQRPELDIPEQYRQVQGWKPAAPADALERGAWWSRYDDWELDALVERLNVSNQNLAAAEAQYRQARALVRGARAAFYPTVSAGVEAGRSSSGSGSQGVTSSSRQDSYDANLGLNWQLDLWGRLRRTLESERANAQASQADLAAARLSLQAELVQNYLQLRVLDEQRRLLDATLEGYQRSLTLTENQYRAGIAPKSDVSQALTQLKSTQAQAVDLEWQRAQLEHAIAVLIGLPPAKFSISVRQGVPQLPDVPPALPSQLLERRPDVASAERSVIAANAGIGVARTAWFPDLSLSALGGYRGSSFADWISLPNRYWSLGPALALELFDGGARRAELERAEAAYDQTVAQYRQTVLDAFREVEDALVELSVLEREQQLQQEAVAAARESLRLIGNQYRAGTVDFNSVVIVQAAALNNERSALTLLGNRLRASVQLVAALGGGWETRELAEQ